MFATILGGHGATSNSLEWDLEVDFPVIPQFAIEKHHFLGIVYLNHYLNHVKSSKYI